ncbi:hypothetical protein H4R21_006978, partial [Coemansia helicoidea]
QDEVVPGRQGQPVLQRGGPAHRGARRAGGADLRLAGDGHAAAVHVQRPAARGQGRGQHAQAPRRGPRRHSADLHGDGAADAVCDARVRAHRGHQHGGVWRVCAGRAGQAHPGLPPQGRPEQQLWAGEPHQDRPVQAAARQGLRHRRLPPRVDHRAAARPAARAARPGPRRVLLGRGARRRRRHGRQRGVCAGRVGPPGVPGLHQRDDGDAQGRGASDGPPHCRASVWAAVHVRGQAGRDDVCVQRLWVGAGPVVHGLRPAAQRQPHGALRGQARRNARRRTAVPGAERARRAGILLRAHRGGDPAARRPRGALPRKVRPHPRARPVPRRRASDARDPPLVD